MTKKMLFLGTSGSVGVPLIGCTCSVCSSKDPFNQRLRPSALLQIEQKFFLIDVGPDFRQQALKYGIAHLEGILLTHAHYDHTAGIDDLRPLYLKRQNPLPILLSSETAHDLHKRYDYLFRPYLDQAVTASRLHLQLLSNAEGESLFEGLTVQHVTYTQGGMAVNGYRIGDFAYISDIKHFPLSLFEVLKGVRYLVISALRPMASPLHFSIDEAVEFSKKLGAKQTWLTHLSHDLDYHQTNACLPENIRLAYDGLEIDLTEVL